MDSSAPHTGLRLLFHSIAVTLVAMLILAFANKLLLQQTGLAVPVAASTTPSFADRMNLRWLLLGNNFLLYAVPAGLALYLTYGKRWVRMAGFVSPVKGQVLPAGGAFVAFLPVVAAAAYLNLQLELPTWMAQKESASGALLASVLHIASTPELLMTLFTVAVVPGISEELFFRGLLQGRLLPYVAAPHAAIWIAAFLFSAIHFQFAGFFPRLLLGAALGYTFRWTQSLWVPVFLHMLFNAIQVLVAHVSGTGPLEGERESVGTSDFFIVLVSLLIVGYLFLRCERFLAARSATGQESR